MPKRWFCHFFYFGNQNLSKPLKFCRPTLGFFL